jgi:hypothetical protein
VLSSEALALTRLILARQSLICEAIELDARYEVLAVLASAHAEVACATGCNGDCADPLQAVHAALMLMPALLDHLELEIAIAWIRLEEVSSGQRR